MHNSTIVIIDENGDVFDWNTKTWVSGETINNATTIAVDDSGEEIQWQ